MKILVVEDDENKREQLVSFLKMEFSGLNCIEAKSYQSGLKELISTTFDIVFLDMTMPTFDRSPAEPGGRIRPFAGREILAQLSRRGIQQRIVVFTMFEVLGEGESQVTSLELDDQLRSHYPKIYYGLIYYDTALNGWKSKVKDALNNLKQ